LPDNLFTKFVKSRIRQRAAREKRGIEHLLVDAIEAFEDGNYGAAADSFELIIALYPDHPLGHLMLGRVYIELKNYDRAMSALFEHLKIVPKSVEAMIYLGLAYYQCNELKLAEARFEEAMKLRAESFLARENLVITKIAEGHLEGALDDLVKLSEERPEDQNIVELLVLTFGRLGKWETAKQYIHNKMAKGQPAVDPAL
jgi:Flp pilus assembly protein TadD